jgi:hypothetical protein
MERLLELIITKALISGVYNYSMWKILYTIPNINLYSVKQAMKNYIRVKEAYVIRQDIYVSTHTREVFLTPLIFNQSI